MEVLKNGIVLPSQENMKLCRKFIIAQRENFVNRFLYLYKKSKKSVVPKHHAFSHAGAPYGGGRVWDLGCQFAS